MRITVEIFCPFFATEEREKVEHALRNVIPLPTYTIKEIAGRSYLYGKASDPKTLEPFQKKLREQRILAAGRKTLKNQIKNEVMQFSIHKQAATEGKISFCHLESESPLGTITIRITSPQLGRLIEWLVPLTRDGKIIEPDESVPWGNR